MRNYTLYKTYSASAFYDAISNKVAHDDEAAYYLLTQRLSGPLRSVYDYHGFGLTDSYDDTIEDFYLYLYEGGSGCGRKPFAMLESIQRKDAFFGWILCTYRNFLLKRAREEEKRRSVTSVPLMESGSNSDPLGEETMRAFLATAIAYADQQFSLRNRFVFYRMLLTVLDHNMALPQEVVAKVLEMNPVTYRVSTKRQKDRFMRFINEQESGKTLDLDDRHCEMRDQILKGFERLYEVLLRYYDRTVQDLPAVEEIEALRHQYSASRASQMHDIQPCYGFRYKLDVKQLYMSLKLSWGG